MKKITAAVIAIMARIVFAEENLGGNIVVWPKNPGLFLFVDCQTRLPTEQIAENVSKLVNEFSIDIRTVKGKFPGIDGISAELADKKAKGAIWIVDDASMPVSLTAAEDGWGILNVAKMLKDNPDKQKLSKRLTKYINRAFGYVNGVSDSPMMPACVMKQAVGLTGIDALLCATFSPEACSKIANYITLAGYKRCRRGTYYDACEEGWAPRPVNEIQKKIWDKVHQLPTKPLVIKPESQRKTK